MTIDGQIQIGKRILTMGIGAVLSNQHLRSERAHHPRHHRVESPQPRGVRGARGHRDVDRRAARRAVPALGREAGAGEQRQRTLMDGHGQHPRIEVERGLHTVAVMGIDVDVPDLAPPASSSAAMPNAASL